MIFQVKTSQNLKIKTENLDDIERKEQDIKPEKIKSLKNLRLFKNIKRPYPVKLLFKKNINAISSEPPEHTNNDDQKVLELIKNRLIALTLFDNDISKIDSISEKYKIEKSSLLKDYFGFQDTDDKLNLQIEDKHEFIVKLNHVKSELEITPLTVDPKTLPKALTSLKYGIPMFFMNKLTDYFAFNYVKDSPLQEAYFDSLYDLKLKLFVNRHDINLLKNIIFEDKSSILNSIRSSIKIEIEDVN